jgi:dolichol-phosphate mannosyltransferase
MPITRDFEILLVDDGSSNDAWQTISALARQSPHVRGIRLLRNFGQHPAISAGLDLANGDWVVVMDSDLQDRPEIIPELYTKARQGHDVVFVNRLRRPEGAIYLFLSRIFYYALNLLAGQSHNRLQGNFSIISRTAVTAFRAVPDRDKFYGGTLYWLGFPAATIQAGHGSRFSGKPSYNFGGRLRLAWRIIIGHSTRLLYLAVAVGVLMALTSFAMAGWVILAKLRHPSSPIPGLAAVVTAVFFTAGVTNIMTGLIGIYLAELFSWSKGRPRYLIGQTVGEHNGLQISAGDP